MASCMYNVVLCLCFFGQQILPKETVLDSCLITTGKEKQRL